MEFEYKVALIGLLIIVFSVLFVPYPINLAGGYVGGYAFGSGLALIWIERHGSW